MSSETIALLGLAGALLATVIAGAITVGKMLEMQRALAEKEKEQDTKLARLDAIPAIQHQLAHVEKNHSLIPKLESRVISLEERAKFSKEWRQSEILRRSRPDPEEES